VARKTPTYRPVSITIWDDHKFLALSDPAQLLFMYFLTASECPIPGVLLAGEATVAERRGWPVERVRSLYAEIIRKGLDVRWEGRVLWTPKSFKHQPVQGPNAMRSMASWWLNIPDVSFKHALWCAMRDACKGWSKEFRELFAEPERVVVVVASPVDQVSLPIAGFESNPVPQPRYEPLPPTPLGNPFPQGVGYKTPGVQDQHQDHHQHLESFRSSSSPTEQGGGDQAQGAGYAARVDPGAIEVLQQYLGRAPAKGGAN